MSHRWTVRAAILVGTGGMVVGAFGQVTRADYARAFNLQKKYDSLVVDLPGIPTWLPQTDKFFYSKSVEGGHDFVLVNAATLTKRSAFDQARLAAALSEASGHSYTALTLPFAGFRFVDGQSAIEFVAADSRWRCDLHAWTCTNLGLLFSIHNGILNYGYDDTPQPDRSRVVEGRPRLHVRI